MLAVTGGSVVVTLKTLGELHTVHMEAIPWAVFHAAPLGGRLGPCFREARTAHWPHTSISLGRHLSMPFPCAHATWCVQCTPEVVHTVALGAFSPPVTSRSEQAEKVTRRWEVRSLRHLRLFTYLPVTIR